MRIAFLSFDFAEYCIRLASTLAESADVLLLLPEMLSNPHLPLLNPRVRFQPFNKPRLSQPLRQIKTNYRLLRQIRAFQPDVIHIQQGHLWVNLALPFLKGYPLVLTIHDQQHHTGDNGSYNTPQRVFDYGFRSATEIIVHAEQIKRDVLERLMLSEEHVHVIPHIAIGGETKSRVEEDENLILFFGRIWPYKGLDYLIRAEPLITSEVPNVKIVIAGEGEDFEHYQRLMVHPEHFIVYNEYVPEDRASELFQQASVIVLPYIEASQSGVVPVAYSYSKPVVATSVGGLPEMVEDGETGYLVPPQDERALAASIVKLLQDKALRYKMGMNGKRKLEAECGADVIAAQTLNVYHQAVAQRRSGAG
jgi:glycosyltransferase involved in cell wall biosynthesis